MKLAYTDEQLQLREALGDMLDAGGPDAFAVLGEMGVLGLSVSEELDGAGAGVLELGIVAAELGRRLTPSAFVPSAVVATLILSECDAAEDELRALVTGEATATFPWALVDPEVRLAPRGAGPLTLDNVPFASKSDRLLVLLADEGPSIGILDLHAEGVSIEPVEAFDETEPLFRVTVDPAAAQIVSRDADDVLARALPRIAAVVAAELAACGEGVLHTAVEYAKVRTQFGRPIGSFQAVKHMLADAYIALEGANALAHHACAALDDDEDEAGDLASLALAAATEAATTATANSLQTFGGIGYTWEQGTHRYLRRVTARAAQFGSADRQLARIATELTGRLLAAQTPPPAPVGGGRS